MEIKNYNELLDTMPESMRNKMPKDIADLDPTEPLVRILQNNTETFEEYAWMLCLTDPMNVLNQIITIAKTIGETFWNKSDNALLGFTESLIYRSLIGDDKNPVDPANRAIILQTINEAVYQMRWSTSLQEDGIQRLASLMLLAADAWLNNKPMHYKGIDKAIHYAIPHRVTNMLADGDGNLGKGILSAISLRRWYSDSKIHEKLAPLHPAYTEWAAKQSEKNRLAKLAASTKFEKMGKPGAYAVTRSGQTIGSIIKSDDPDIRWKMYTAEDAPRYIGMCETLKGAKEVMGIYEHGDIDKA